jgi:Tol biopolymer transport system component
MLHLHNSQNHARRLACLMLATALLTGVAAHTGYSSTQTPKTIHKRKGITSKQMQTPMTSTRQNGKIAFVREDGGGEQIYVVNPDGSNQTRLTNDSAHNIEPAWSPDGAKIAFSSDRGGRFAIYAMDSDGGNVIRLTDNASANVSHPTWSPDGTRIAFTSDRDGNQEIYVMNSDGSNQTRITNNPAGDGYPAWSPDGTKIAFASNRLGGDYDIFLMNADGSNQTLLVGDLGDDLSPTWSPDGSQIAYSGHDFEFIVFGYLDFGTFIYQASAVDGSLVSFPAASEFTNNWSPAWSPDGKKIAYAGDTQVFHGDFQIYTTDLDGGMGARLTNNSAVDLQPAWQSLPVVPPILNPLDDAQFFVRQQYRDFLNREPDPDGLAFWTSEINSCGTDAQCLEAKRVNVSAAYFLSIEFQQTGYLVYRIYKASYGNLPGAPVPITRSEFLPDTQKIGQGVIVNQANWEQMLENNKQAFTSEFVQRPRFTSAYPTSMTPAGFVDTLFTNAGVTPSEGDRTAAINEFAFAPTTTDVAARARALRRVAENATLAQQEFNRAFVLMQYFGYLRRNPNDPPEVTLDFQGYTFWLNKLDGFNGNFQNAEMVKAFLLSGEYRHRFGP